MKRKSSIRRMVGMPVSRDYYRTLGQVRGLLTRLEHLGPKIEHLELDASAMAKRAVFEMILAKAREKEKEFK